MAQVSAGGLDEFGNSKSGVVVVVVVVGTAGLTGRDAVDTGAVPVCADLVDLTRKCTSCQLIG